MISLCRAIQPIGDDMPAWLAPSAPMSLMRWACVESAAKRLEGSSPAQARKAGHFGKSDITASSPRSA